MEMTGFSRRCDTFGSLFSLPEQGLLHPSGQTPQSLSRLPLAVKRDSRWVILLLNFFPNRSPGERFESAVGFLMALHINGEEPAL